MTTSIKVIGACVAAFAIAQIALLIIARVRHIRTGRALFTIIALQYVIPMTTIGIALLSPMRPSEFGYMHDLQFLPVIVTMWWVPLCMIASVVPMAIITHSLLREEKMDRTSGSEWEQPQPPMMSGDLR